MYTYILWITNKIIIIVFIIIQVNQFFIDLNAKKNTQCSTEKSSQQLNHEINNNNKMYNENSILFYMLANKLNSKIVWFKIY